MAGCCVVRSGTVSQSTCLSEFLENNSIHGTSEIFIEEGDRRFEIHAVGLPIIAVLEKFDSFRFIRSQINLIDGSLLLGITVSKWLNILEVCLCLLVHLMRFLNDFGNFLLRRRPIIECDLRILSEGLQFANEICRASRTHLISTGNVCIGIDRTILTVSTQTGETLVLVRFGKFSFVQFVFHQCAINIFIGLQTFQPVLHQPDGCLLILCQTRDIDRRGIGSA